MRRLFVLICICMTGLSNLVYAAQDSLRSKMPPSIQESAREPIKYVGAVFCDKHYYDGRPRYAIGVHSYQATRANRAKPPEGGMLGWTYNHQPYLCYWKGRFYLQYLSNLKEEHVPPGRLLRMLEMRRDKLSIDSGVKVATTAAAFGHSTTRMGRRNLNPHGKTTSAKVSLHCGTMRAK